MSILDEAHNAVHVSRREDYEHPAVFFTKWAAYLTILLSDDLQPGKVVSAEKANLAMILFKTVREASNPKKDNRIDGAGYFETLDMIEEYKSNK